MTRNVNDNRRATSKDVINPHKPKADQAVSYDLEDYLWKLIRLYAVTA